MKCGHIAQGTNYNTGKPVCVLCVGIIPGADIVHEEIVDNKLGLEERKTKCSYCKNERDSSWDVPFFEHRPNMEKDEYYCGCRGWD